MHILTDAVEAKDITSLEKVEGLINKVTASTLSCTNKVIDEDYQLGTDVQNALNDLLDHVYLNASGVKSLQTSMASAWEKINELSSSSYTGGSGIVVTNNVIGHSNNLSAGGTVNSTTAQTPDFGESATLDYFKYDKQGHVTSKGSSTIKIPTAETVLSESSVRPISSKAVYDNLIASKTRSTARTVGSGSTAVSIGDNVQTTLENFQGNIYNLYTNVNSLGTNVSTLNDYKDELNVTVGGPTAPIYFKNGVPATGQYTLGSICTKSSGDYLPITGGTLTGKLGVSSDVTVSTSKATIDGSVPVAGSTISVTSLTELKDYKTLIGVVIKPADNSWHNVISVRHRNGYSDGANYGMYITTPLTMSGNLVWNKQIGSSKWQGERVILDSSNFKEYLPETPTPVTITVDSALNATSENPVMNKTLYSSINDITQDITDLTQKLSSTDSVVTGLSNSLQGAYNKFADYLPLSGGTMNTNVAIEIPSTSAGRHMTYKSTQICHVAPSTSEEYWTSGFEYYKTDGTTMIGGIKAFGKGDTINYYFLGNNHLKPIAKVEPNGTVTATTFKGNLSGNSTSATKLNGVNSGSDDRPIYFKDGLPTASNTSIGGAYTPIYMYDGVLTGFSNSLGGKRKPVYLSSGQLTECDSEFATANHTHSGYASTNHTHTTLDSTVTAGNAQNCVPCAIENGVFKSFTQTLGSTTKPVYLSSGQLKTCSTFATSNHTHSNYASSSHTHSEYALVDHEHSTFVTAPLAADSRYSELTPGRVTHYIPNSSTFTSGMEFKTLSKSAIGLIGIYGTGGTVKYYYIGKYYDNPYFKVEATGTATAKKFNATGADFAEMYEWSDGNPDNEDRRGLFVTFDGEKIRPAKSSDDYILGAVSSTAAVIGDTYDIEWQGKYKKDIFGQPLTRIVEKVNEETGETYTEEEYILNEDYDENAEYISRLNRQEWAIVGTFGKLIVTDDGTCEVNGYCVLTNGGIATKSNSHDGYRVLTRLDENHIKIQFK